MDFNKILGLKVSSNNQMEFSRESHQEKLKMLIKSFNKHILKLLGSHPHLSEHQIISHLALFEILAHQVGESLVVEVASGDIEMRLV